MAARGLIGNVAVAGGNLVRSMRRRGLECISLPIEGSYPEWPPRRPRLPFPLSFMVPFTRQVSLSDMRAATRMIGADNRVRCVVVQFGPLDAGLATLYSVRRLLLALRSKGKRLVAWMPSAGIAECYLASVCDDVLLPESGRVSALGLRAEAIFLKDALALVGVEADLEAIAEYKVAPDTFRRSTMSEPHRFMLNAALDSYFEHIVSVIAEGRGLSTERVREIIDAMPMDAPRAVEAGLADGVAYEDELQAYVSGGDGNGETRGGTPSAPVATWDQASRWLRRPVRRKTRQAIGVVSLEGLMVLGHSRRSPVPLPIPFVQAQAGSATVVQALRQAEADRRIAAVIFHIETPGGSALASDLICREVRRLRARKPVVALMGGQATSGGYYAAAWANRIIARPTTMTGSIGIWGGKFVLRGLYTKLGVGTEAVERGAMAGLYSGSESFDAAQRARVRRDLGTAYARFIGVVAQGRRMAEEDVEDVARGRIWTGAQAVEIGLVDELGDFETALDHAKELAGLDADETPTIVRVHAGRRELAPLPYLDDRSAWWPALNSLRALAREGVWALSPWMVRMGS